MKYLSLLSLLLMLSISHCDLKDTIDDLFIDVTGNVSDDGAPVGGALILLLDSPNITDGISLSNGTISGSDGDYRILKVDEGDYYVVAVDDANGNFQFDADTDRFGFHGVDPTSLQLLPRQISVSGEDVDGINITYLTSL